jgi:hypothetical protein
MTAVPQGRVQIIQVPIALPGKCVICGSVGGDGRKFIDFSWQMDWYGAIIFCENCMTEVMDVIGYVHEDTHNELKTRYENLIQEAGALAKINEELKNVLRNAFGIDPDRTDSYPDSGGMLSTNDAIPEDNERNAESTNVGDAFTIEPSGEQGSDDVPAPTTSADKSGSKQSRSRKPAEPNLTF